MKKIYRSVLCLFMFTQCIALQSSAQEGITVAGGHGEGSAANQLGPRDVVVDKAGNVYVADLGNNRIQKWAPGATEGITVAGGNDRGTAANQLFGPYGVDIDGAGNVYVADYANNRIQKWAPGASEGVTVAGGNGLGNQPNQFAYPRSVSLDASGNLIVLDYYNTRVQKWVPGAAAGVTAIPIRGNGSAPDQINFSEDAFVDAAGNIYIADTYNNRVQKWAPGATAGVTVAGGNGAGSAPNQLNTPFGVFVDGNGNVYVADAFNNRIQKWAPGATEGITVAGGANASTPSTQLSFPTSVFIDDPGNIYVADSYNYRVQKFGSSGLAFKYYEGIWNTLPDFNSLTPAKTGISATIDIAARTPGRNDNFAFVWEGYIKIATPGTYTFETVSDDGSKIYFNSLYNPSANALVSNDGLHAPVSATGTVTIPSAGVYPITITYFEKDGGEQMKVYWTAPGIGRQLIPDTAFTQTPPPPATGGLAYKYYEGIWQTLPDFNTLTPVKTGSSANVDINQRTPGRNDNFAFLWQGYIKITNPGTYTFETVSDDGSKIYFNAAYNAAAPATVNNDGLHAPVSATGTITIPAAGIFPISISFFEKDGGEQIQVYWTGPGIPRQLIPNSAFTQAPPPPSGGLTYKYYEGAWDALPDFNLLTPVKTGNSANTDLGLRNPGRNDYFGFVWEGHIQIVNPGTYTFETVSDDGSKLYFNSLYSSSAIPTVSNDGLHAPVSATGTVTIAAAGWYPIVMTFFEKDGGEQMQVYWTGPGISRQLIPNSAFIQTPLPGFAQTANTDLKNTIPMEMTRENAIQTIYPNPFKENFNIDFYNSSAGNNIYLGIYDLKGKLIYTQRASNMSKGNTTLKVNLKGNQLPGGMYMARLLINGVPATTVKLIKLK